MLQDLRYRTAAGITQNAESMFKITMDLHIPEGKKSIKPSICHRLHNLRKTLTLDPLLQILPLSSYLSGKGPTAYYGHITFLFNRLYLAFVFDSP